MKIRIRPVSATLTEDGRFEIVDSTPLEAPLDLKPSPGLTEIVRDLVRREMSQVADQLGYETFEEADDFDIEDDPLDPLTEYEKVFDFPAASAAPGEAVQGVAGAPGGDKAPLPSSPPGDLPKPLAGPSGGDAAPKIPEEKVQQ